LAGNRAAVLLLNRDPSAAKAITLRGSDLGFKGTWKARDLFAKKDLGGSQSTLTQTVASHAGMFLLISPR
ncbi:MAG TPA: hypothetical protein VM029_07970, partial [Opitutaceae bacterium]|nr:hypothetical protein [Opitutaceae bacterium]